MTKLYCEKCIEKPASFFYEENRGGKRIKIQLCSHCARELGLLEEREDDLFSFPFFLNRGAEDLFSFPLFLNRGAEDLFSFPLFLNRGGKKSEKKCPVCGMTLSAIQRGGKFGCSSCYDTFAKDLDPSSFAGHFRREEQKAQGEGDTLSQMKKELKEAIKKEEYDKAAVLRDRIRAQEGR